MVLDLTTNEGAFDDVHCNEFWKRSSMISISDLRSRVALVLRSVSALVVVSYCARFEKNPFGGYFTNENQSDEFRYYASHFQVLFHFG